MQLLIHHDHNLLEISNSYGMTPLLYFIQKGQSEIIRFLLDRAANVHAAAKLGATTLMLACTRGNLDMVRLMLAAGVDVKARTHRRQESALHFAALEGHEEVVRELVLVHNANMFAVDTNWRTPFDLACSENRSRTEDLTEVIHWLIQAYSNKLTQDHDRLALHELLNVSDYSYI